jgi:CO/xanthine dehydrogenase Mo-binding subunit
MAEKLIGKSPPRKEGPQKVTGKRLYIDDLRLPNMLYGVTVRSSVARGKIRAVVFEPGIVWDEYVIVTAKDISAANHVALILDDQPYLASEFINHPEEAVVLLAHPDKHKLEIARLKVRIDIDPLPAVFDIAESLTGKEVIWGQDNIFKAIDIHKGDVDAAWAKAFKIVEGEYHTGAQEQLYIEPNGMIAQVDADTGVTVWGSLQCPYYVHKALKALFSLSDDKVRVIQAETGGGFGGKEEYPSIIAGHAALLAQKAGKPVKLIYDRAEDMVATTKRHPSRTRHRTAVDKDGKLLAMDIDFVLDGGAYATKRSFRI